MEAQQNYANHAHRPTGWVITALLAVVAFAIMVLFVLRQLTVFTVGLLILSLAVLGLVSLIRRYATRLQDRIIRLEMRLRLTAIGREHLVARLTTGQIVALRFASDAELPALTDRALAENLAPESDQARGDRLAGRPVADLIGLRAAGFGLPATGSGPSPEFSPSSDARGHLACNQTSIMGSPPVKGQPSVAIVVPLSHKTTYTADEEASFRHLRHHLGRYDKYVVIPESHPGVYPGLLPKRFPDHYFGDARVDDSLLRAAAFYRAFDAYEFILVHRIGAL